MTVRVLAVPLGLLVLFLAVSVYGAATTPGNENFKAKWADWLRSHQAALRGAIAHKPRRGPHIPVDGATQN